ncbi:MBL fold metallo-hydrolase [Pedobacter sp. HMF7647]|uniref:MBL fold metallo-hydrolase n=1 Tax=Hufsiella arboris TaxID=2695275 RepID=A0A7K1YCM6_9SPHI|nr:MBL fold metallo-hydrolase [Hufsiella arboris]MXV52325.1 MBL fold metallo-hydrolase [Hufsiella arboris]
MKLYSINTGNFKLDGGAMFGVVPKTIWQKTNPADANNLCTWAMRSLLIEDEGRLILIDTGIGNKQSEKFFSHYFLHGDDTLDKSLAKNGFNRDDITDVFLTHLHFDHVGGAVVRENDRLIPAFKNAVFWSNAKHWDWAVNPNEREKASFLSENILPLKESGKLQFIQEEQDVSFSSNISLKFVYGHTDAMMLPVIRYKDKTIVYMADLVPSVGHIPLPYVMAYDMFPLKTLTEKQAFMKEAASNDYILFLEHDPVNECCTLTQTEDKIRLKSTFLLKDIL